MLQSGTEVEHKETGEIARYLASIVTSGQGILHVLVGEAGNYIMKLGTELTDQFHTAKTAEPLPGSVASVGQHAPVSQADIGAIVRQAMSDFMTDMHPKDAETYPEPPMTEQSPLVQDSESKG